MKTNKKNQNQNQETNNVSGLRSRSEQPLGTKPEEKAKEVTTNSQDTWKGVFFDGPEPEQDREGEEIPVWSVFVGDADANPLSKVYRVFSFAKAESLAKAMSHDRKLELVAEAMPA